jgi:hypothetical protein
VEVRANTLAIPLQVWSVGGPTQHRGGFVIADNVSRARGSGRRGNVELVYVDGAVITGNKVSVGSAAKRKRAEASIKPVRIWGSKGVRIERNSFLGAAAPLEVDGLRFKRKWKGPKSTAYSTCGNTFGPAGLDADAAC